MAYFDSSKNRALWEIELQGLRKAKADRQAGKTSGEVQKKEAVKEKTGREPVRMNYAALLKEEAAAMKRSPKRERSAIHMEKQVQKSTEKSMEKSAEKGRTL